MTKVQLLLLLTAVFLGFFNLFRGGAASDPARSSTVSQTVTNYVVCVTSNNVCFSGSSTNGVLSSSGVLVKRGAFKYFSRTSSCSDYVLFENARLVSGMPCEYGYVKSISPGMVSGETFEGGIFYILPTFPPPPIEGGSVVIQRSGEPHPSRRGPF